MGVVFAVIKVFPASKQHVQALEILQSVQDLTRPVAGCMGCWVSEESFQQPHLMYVEQWQSEEALQEHLRSDLYRRVLGTLELSKQRPEISFYFTSHERGLDLIEAARREGKRSNPVRAST